MSHPRPIPSTRKPKAEAGSKEETENALQKRFVTLLEKHGYLVLRTGAGHLKLTGEFGAERHINIGEKGRSDITACSPTGQFVAVEVKRLGKKPNEKQRAYLDKVIERGGIGIYADSIEMLREKLGLPARPPKP